MSLNAFAAGTLARTPLGELPDPDALAGFEGTALWQEGGEKGRKGRGEEVGMRMGGNRMGWVK